MPDGPSDTTRLPGVCVAIVESPLSGSPEGVTWAWFDLDAATIVPQDNHTRDQE